MISGDMLDNRPRASGPAEDSLLCRVDTALKKPEDLVIERAPVAHGQRRELFVQNPRQPQCKMNDLPSLLLANFSHGTSLTHPMILCQYHYGIDSYGHPLYTAMVSSCIYRGIL